MNISDFDYDLPQERIARFPLAERDGSRLLVWRAGERDGADGEGADGEISETIFGAIGAELPAGSLLIFNDTRVVRARLVMHRPTAPDASQPGARIEIMCLEPADPADYERAFAARGSCQWHCMVGNSKRWRSGPVTIPYIYRGARGELRAWRASGGGDVVRFEWDGELGFGELLELLGRVPIPPYLGRDEAAIDRARYQTVYATIEGSVAAPTAGLHFTPELIDGLRAQEIDTERVTLHVGAGTFLPVKVENALEHAMHTEHFEVTLSAIERLAAQKGPVIAVGTTSVRTLESLAALAWRIEQSSGGSGQWRRPVRIGAVSEHSVVQDDRTGRNGALAACEQSAGKGDPEVETPVGQFEPGEIPEEFGGGEALTTLAGYMRARGIDRLRASTRIMITPGFRFRIVGGIVTNFHQPRSTLLLLIAAFTGGEQWRRIYDYALKNDFRFLSYGDSSLLLR